MLPRNKYSIQTDVQLLLVLLILTAADQELFLPGEAVRREKVFWPVGD